MGWRLLTGEQGTGDFRSNRGWSSALGTWKAVLLVGRKLLGGLQTNLDCGLKLLGARWQHLYDDAWVSAMGPWSAGHAHVTCCENRVGT